MVLLLVGGDEVLHRIAVTLTHRSFHLMQKQKWNYHWNVEFYIFMYVKMRRKETSFVSIGEGTLLIPCHLQKAKRCLIRDLLYSSQDRIIFTYNQGSTNVSTGHFQCHTEGCLKMGPGQKPSIILSQSGNAWPSPLGNF